MAREEPQINIRIPQELKDRIKIAAKEAKRSLNAEVVSLIEKGFDYTSTTELRRRKRSTDKQLEAMHAKLAHFQETQRKQSTYFLKLLENLEFMDKEQRAHVAAALADAIYSSSDEKND